MSDAQERLNELEVRYAHQEMVIEELHGVLVEFGRRLERLEGESRRYHEMLARLAPSLPESPDE